MSGYNLGLFSAKAVNRVEMTGDARASELQKACCIRSDSRGCGDRSGFWRWAHVLGLAWKRDRD
ncbi:hypothetical protein E2562_017637 [Oryza meyeriana var. granulata]|uniref:Uncharacterized protein n=1 Tax=Oryza meyeriana var. granulata TaxID=110450 RepID=A0A6G1BY77_9ORYZ|nr:hypothetical protein E2562_017637 [Oryza meyeriana var. granulata]